MKALVLVSSEQMALGFPSSPRMLARVAAHAAWSMRRLATVSLAIFALYVQLVAAAGCTMGSPPRAALIGFPICHAQSSGDDFSGPHKRGDAPDHQHACPFCSIHCHAALAFMPVVGIPAPPPRVAAVAEPAPIAVRSAARFPAGAPPRGPPAAV